MASLGVSRTTGRLLSGWEHTLQSLKVIFITRPGDRLMRRTFGSAVPGLLGKNLVPTVLLRYYTAIAIAIELWEPRYKIRAVSYPGNENSAHLARQGRLGFTLTGDYMPRALEGDFTIEGPEQTAKV